MSASWADVRALQEQLFTVQTEVAKNRLSERNCVAVIQRLITLGWLDVHFSCDGKEYITPAQLERDILDELTLSGGRVAVTDLSQTLNLDYSHVEKKVAELLAHDSTLSLHYGELVSKQFFDNLAVEINETLQETGLLPLAQLSRDVSLPVTTLSKELIPRIGVIISGTYDKKTDTLFTTAYVERQSAKLRGACSAATRPVQLGKIFENHKITPSLGHNCVKEMIASGRLQGQLHGQSNNPVFIPGLYTAAQHQWADSFYYQNGYLTIAMMANKGIDNPHTVISRYDDAVSLPSGCVRKVALVGRQSLVEDTLAAEGYIELTDWMFEWCEPADEAKIVDRFMESMDAEKYRVLPSKTLISVDLLNSLLDQFGDRIASKAATDAANPKILVSLKKFDDASAMLSDGSKPSKKSKGGKRGKGGKGGKSREMDDDAPVSFAPVLGPTFLTPDQVAAELANFELFKSVEPKEEETLGEIGDLLKKQLDEKYRLALEEEMRKKTQKSSKAQQRVDEDMINNLYNTIIQCEKGLKVFEDAIRGQIERHILKTLGTDLTKATFSVLAEEYECPYNVDTSKMESLIPYLPKDAKPHGTSIISSVTSGSNVADFLETYTALTDPQYTQLMVRKLDKKKERNLVFAKKQSLLETLKTEEKAGELLSIGSSLIFLKQHSAFLHVPGRCISAVLKIVSKDLPHDEHHLLDVLQGEVVDELRGDGEMGEERKTILRKLVTDIVFVKKEAEQ